MSKNEINTLLLDSSKAELNRLIQRAAEGSILSYEAKDMQKLWYEVNQMQNKVYGTSFSELNEALKETMKVCQFANQQLSKTAKIATEMSDSNTRQHDLYSLVEHFIVKNELVDQFVYFLKDVAENEELEEYREVAKSKFNLYHYDFNGETHYFIDDHYGWLKEEEVFED